MESIFHIGNFGYIDGMADAGPAIQAAIDATPDFIVNSGRPARSSIVLLPQPDSGEITITSKVFLRSNKSVEIRGEGSHSSILVCWAGDGGYWLRIEDGQRVAALRNLNMNDGGVEIEGNTRKHWGVFDCTFKDSPDWAIKTLGPSVISGTLDNIIFAECANGIFFTHDASDVNVLRDLAFLGIPGTALRLRTSGIHAYDLDFERCGLPLHLDEVFPDLAYGDLRFTRLRFGSEHPSPKYEILIGNDESTTSSVLMGDTHFTDCYFRAIPTDENEAQAILKLMNPVRYLQFLNCTYWEYGAFAEEDYIPAHGGQRVQDNIIFGSQPDMGFSHGGVGWNRVPALRKASSDSVVSSDSGIDIADVSLWIPDDITVTEDATDPTGATNSAYTLTRTGSGNASIKMAVNGLDDGHEHYTFSTWARGVDEFVMRLSFLTPTYKWLYFQVPIKLSARWQKYWVTFPSKAAGIEGKLNIAVGEATDGKAEGMIEIWSPKLDYGQIPG